MQQSRQTTATDSVAGAESAPSFSRRSGVGRLNMKGVEPIASQLSGGFWSYIPNFFESEAQAVVPSPQITGVANERWR